eukprot:EG_transcript_2302
MLLSLLLLLLGGCPTPATGQPIIIGMSGPLFQDIGNRTAVGLAFAFEEANRAGGLLGRNLSLIALNDDFNVTTAFANVRRLLFQEGALLLAGVVGSDIALRAKPYITRDQVPYVGAVTGAAEIHSPFSREFVNLQVPYTDEMVVHALFLVQYSMVQRVACVYQANTFGQQGYTSLVAALANVGIQLVASVETPQTTAGVAAALEAIAGAPLKAQAVVLATSQEVAVQFIPLFLADSRTDSGCVFTVMTRGWGSTYRTQVDPALWGHIYFFFSAPLPGDPSWAIATHFATAFSAAGNSPDPTAFAGYLTGRLVVDVLQRTHSASPTRAMFLNEVYNDRLFVLDDLVVGMYSTNYSGCDQALCACNSGLRSVFSAQLDPATGTLGPCLGSVRYSVLQCSNPVSSVTAPLLFGQLVPNWDAGWRTVGLEIGQGIRQAFAEVNAGGVAGGRSFILLQHNYSSNATHAISALVDRYPLVALAGSVVLETDGLGAPVPSFGNFDIEADVAADPFSRREVHLQAATALEWMALAKWAAQNCSAIHLRAPASEDGEAILGVLIKSVHSFQREAASASTYSTSTDVLATTQRGCVIALGSDADVVAWYAALPAYPALHVLTLSGAAMRLMAVFPNASACPQAARLHFATTTPGRWNTTLPAVEPSEPWKYGYVLGKVVTQALIHSEYAANSYTTSAELLNAWYTVKVMTSGSLTFGPYYGDNCSAGVSECECNEGVRTVAVRTVASSAPQCLYSISTCHVVYTALAGAGDTGGVVAATVGAVVGVVGFVAVGLALYLRLTRRSHSAAPKDATKPFCVLFTDIQASTHLWATVPDVMAHALSMHHLVIRKAIASHHCYEVKTIGDSFMVAADSPLPAMRLALAVQTALHEYDWGTDAIDSTYRDLLNTEERGRVSRTCWNGLRVRVGVHYGLGDVQFDPVTKAFDYYGTVVNTA